MTKPSKTRKTFTRNTFAEHNYNFVHQSKTNQTHPPPPPKKYAKPKPRMFSLLEFSKYIDQFSKFPKNKHPPQDYSENHPFFQQNNN